MKTTAVFVVALLATSLGCNSILGIDAARLLDTNDGGLDATAVVPEVDSATSQSDAVAPQADAGCSLHRSTACNTCVADKCCAEFEACNADPECKQGLIDYAFCLGNNFTSDAGATCDENFIGTARKANVDLANCAFIEKDKCQEVCSGQTIGDDLCTTYCGCMQTVCNDHPFEAATCAEICSKFDANQLVCRPYHCNLANLTKSDESKRTLHCGHASGNAPCH